MTPDVQTRAGIATFKELCLDTHPVDGTGVADLSRFWAAATGAEQRFFTGGDEDCGDVVGAVEGMGIALCPVPERRTVKHRVHLDVLTSSVAALVALGAAVVREPDDDIGWTVMTDPEGGELCAFLRPAEQLPAYRVLELSVDAVDAVAIGSWWAEVFGVELRSRPGQTWHWLEDVPGAPFEAWVFADVPEPKTVKNRLHWDVYGDVADFLDRGATVLWTMPRWTVLADPEGNEFCVFPPPGA